MSKRVWQSCVLILVQAGCVAVGLWMHSRFVASGAREAALDQAAAGLRRCAAELERLPAPAEMSAAAWNREWTTRARAVVEQARGGVAGAMIASISGRVLVAVDTAPAATRSVAPIETVAWLALESDARDGDSVRRGMLELSDGPHLAVAQPLPDGRGYVLTHAPAAELFAANVALMGALPHIAGTTFLWITALIGIVGFAMISRIHDRFDCERTRLNADSLRMTQSLVRTRDAVVFGLAKLAESRDPDTGEHLERISAYSTALASALRGLPKYSAKATPSFVRLIGISSALHDIGKVGIEDRILLKRGSLTDAERTSIEAHARIGGTCLREIEQRLGGSNFLQMAREVALHHHERWDGTGYPNGLAGEAIPLAARIVAVVDVYDALTSRRVYKEPYPYERSLEIIKKDAGGHFDPALVEVWLRIEPALRRIALQYVDGRAAGDGAGAVACVAGEALGVAGGDVSSETMFIQ